MYGMITLLCSAKKFKKMKADEIIPSWDDIIFEKRNKLYGAYELRQKYNARVSRALLITIISSSLVFFLLSRNKPAVNSNLFSVRTDSIIFNQNYIVEQVRQFTRPSVPSSPSVGRPEENAYSLVTDTVEEVEKDTTENSSGLGTGQSTAGNGPVASTVTVTPGPDFPVAPSIHKMASVDKMPGFPGGIEKFYKYLINKIQYTREARAAGLTGRLFVRFVIDEQGLVSDVKVLSRIGFGLDEQVESVLRTSPKWEPGSVRNIAVKTEMVLPVSFTLVK